MKTRIIAGALFLAALSYSAFAAPSLSGTNIPVDLGVLGTSSTLQDTQTGFGDNLSESDGMYVSNDASNLYFGITGNMENSSGNRLVILFDTKAGGVNVMPDAFGGMSGQSHLSFGGSFLPDYAVAINIFANVAYFDLKDLQTGTDTYLGSANVGGGASALTASSNTYGATAGFDNSNILGVGGGALGAQQALAATALNGMEMGLPLSSLGIANNSLICMSSYITSSNGYFANQFLPGMGGGGNIGFANFTQSSCLQRAIVPEPGSIMAMATGLLGLVGLRRRK